MIPWLNLNLAGFWKGTKILYQPKIMVIKEHKLREKGNPCALSHKDHLMQEHAPLAPLPQECFLQRRSPELLCVV